MLKQNLPGIMKTMISSGRKEVSLMKFEHLSSRISEISRRNPTNAAIKYGNRTITYGELEKESNRIANFLYNKTKEVHRRPHHVLIILDRSPELIESIVGVLKCGLVFIPFDPRYPKNRVEVFLKESGAQWLITSIEYYEKFKEFIEREREEKDLNVLLVKGKVKGKDCRRYIFSVDNDMDRVNDHLTFESIYSKYAYIYFTSGSTGIPRGVLGRHRSLVHYIQWEIKEFGINEHFNISQFTSPSFDPFLRDIFVPLLAGGICCIPDDDTLMNPMQLKDWIEKNQVTLMHIVPSLFKTLLMEIDTPNCFTHLKYVLLAGELLRGNDIEKFIDLFDKSIQLVNLYGPTETTLAKLFYRIKPGDVSRSVIPVGKPIDGAQAMILDNEMQECFIGNIGEVYIRTPFISSGYFNDRDLNKMVFVKNPHNNNPQDIIYKTGDLGKVLPDGNIELVGRVDHQVKIRGMRIELGEIESQLLKHDKIKDVVVAVKEDEEGGKNLCAFIISSGTVKASELREYLSRQLPAYMIPSYFMKLEEIPLTPNGKVDRRALPEPGIETSMAEDYTAPGNRIEKMLTVIWSEILGIEPQRIGIDANFFELGGHSLKATLLIVKIHKTFNVRIKISQVFGNPTVKKLAACIERAKEDIFTSINALEKREYYPLSSAQKRLFFLQQMDPQSTSYHMTTVDMFEGNLSEEKMNRLFNRLIKRHESLRTFFEMINGELVQRIREAHDIKFEVDFYKKSEDEVKDFAKSYISPFDLSKAPLLRVGLINLKENKYILMADMHHIVSDGLSRIILIKEFIALYAGLQLPVLRLQYRDFSEWHNHMIKSGIKAKQAKYWLKRFEGEVPVLKLPTDYERPETLSFEGQTLHFAVDQEQTMVLKSWLAPQGITLYMMMIAILSIFLSKLGDQEDIIIGTPIAGRRHADLDPIIGMFVNTLAIRNYPEGEKTFNQFLEEVKQNTLQAFENQEYQYEELVEKVGLDRNFNRNPLFDVLLALQNVEVRTGSIPEPENLDLKPIPFIFEEEISHFDLIFNVQEVGDILSFIVFYRTRLFKKETIERFVGYFKEIMLFIAANKDEDFKLKEIRISHDLVAPKLQIIEEEEGDFGF